MSLENLISALLSILKYLKPQNSQGPIEKNEGVGMRGGMEEKDRNLTKR